MRFNSLPNPIQEQILNLIFASTGCGLDALTAQARLTKLGTMSDDEIKTAWHNRVGGGV